jgi:hypothetical protein
MEPRGGAWCRPAIAALAGEPRAGFHARRLPAPLPDWALWDVVGTIAAALGTAYLSGRHPAWCLAGWFALAQVVHVLACVPTAGRASLGL